MNKNRVFGALGVIVLILAIATGAYFYQQSLDDSKSSQPNDSNVEPATPSSGVDPAEGDNVPDSITEKSEDGVGITLNGLVRGIRVTSPLEIAGSVPGSWSHEGEFPVRLLDSNSEVLAEGVAKLDGEWTTEQPVPFKASLEFDKQPEGVGIIVFERANPSGLAENADSLTFPISF